MSLPKLSPLFLRFVVASAISSGMTLAWNALFIEVFHWRPEWAYALTLVLVTCQNFCVMRWFVIRVKSEKVWPMFLQFVLSVAGFRGAEMLLFALMINLLSLHWLLATVINQALFFLVKFFFYQKNVFVSDRPSGD